MGGGALVPLVDGGLQVLAEVFYMLLRSVRNEKKGMRKNKYVVDMLQYYSVLHTVSEHIYIYRLNFHPWLAEQH